MKRFVFLLALAVQLVAAGCEELDDSPEKYPDSEIFVPLEDVAVLLSEIRMEEEQLREVYDAVTSSSWNGYDEEYMMRDLFVVPGAGVGDDRLPLAAVPAKRKALGKPETKVGIEYARPVRELIAERLAQRVVSKSGGGESGDGLSVGTSSRELSPEEYMSVLQKSDIQIYWPYSEKWDGKEYPVITFDPDNGSSVNVGYRLVAGEDGAPEIEEIIVDEEFASEHPVWVVNRNDDSEYTSLELLRMYEPEWGEDGGDIIVKPKRSVAWPGLETKAPGPLKTLILRDFTMNRNFDPWFAGASEFFVKIGGIDEFYASTEAEMRLYNPSVTDFMIVVKRKNVGVPQPFNAILLSDWTEQLTHCAFMIIDDDGGTRTTWNCSGVVKINSKSYGFEISIPLNSRDDIVWRGQLSRKYIEASNGMTAHYGDVDLVFEIVEY